MTESPLIPAIRIKITITLKIKKENNLDVTIGLQMVLQPKDIDQVIINIISSVIVKTCASL